MAIFRILGKSPKVHYANIARPHPSKIAALAWLRFRFRLPDVNSPKVISNLEQTLVTKSCNEISNFALLSINALAFFITPETKPPLPKIRSSPFSRSPFFAPVKTRLEKYFLHFILLYFNIN